jgi:hypothetical protein
LKQAGHHQNDCTRERSSRHSLATECLLCCLAEVPELRRYSPLVKRKETDRIMGAASTTTGSIAAQEINSQWMGNWLIVTKGKLAIPAAIRHVTPA